MPLAMPFVRYVHLLIVGAALCLVAAPTARETGGPGFYAAAPQQPPADVIPRAGGLTRRARAGDIRVERGATPIWSGARLGDGRGLGYSIDQLNLRAGDRLFVPTRGDSERTFRIIGVLISIPLAIFTVTRLR